MGRINVELPDELEKKLRFKTIERFGGKKGDLSRAVEEAVKTWVTPKEQNPQKKAVSLVIGNNTLTHALNPKKSLFAQRKDPR